MLEHQVRLAAVGDPRVDQAGDVGMGEPGEHAPLAAEPLAPHRVEQREVEELDGDLALEAAVAPVGEPDAAHAAAPEQSLEREGADALPGERGRADRGIGVPRGTGPGPGSKEALPVELGLGREDRLELGRKLGMLGAHPREPGVARFGGDLEYLIEQPVQEGDGRGIACHMAA